MSGNSCVVICGLSSAILRAPSPDGASDGRAEDVVGAVRHQERPLDLRHERREVHLLHREAGLAHGVRVVDADHRADGRERVLALLALEERGADRLRRDVVGEVVPRHRLGHPAPDAEERRAVDVRLREGDVGARRDHAVAVVRRERDRDHPAHRRAVDEHALERRARRAASRRRRPSPRSCTTRAGSSRRRSRGRRTRAAGSPCSRKPSLTKPKLCRPKRPPPNWITTGPSSGPVSS